VKIFYNQKEVCSSRPQSLGPRFIVSIGQLFPIRILQWPESLKVELHEEGGTFAHHLVAEMYIPFPSRYDPYFWFLEILMLFPGSAQNVEDVVSTCQFGCMFLVCNY
jgi:hypothetical protein